jgi:hypothetical protein
MEHFGSCALHATMNAALLPAGIAPILSLKRDNPQTHRYNKAKGTLF